MTVSIHPTAVVDAKAELGAGVTIGPYCVVEGHKVVIGDGARLDAFAQVKQCTTIGRGAHLHSYACVGGDPQHMGYKGEETFAEVGEETIIREHVTVHRGTPKAHGRTTVGSRCLLMAYVHVAHDCEIADNVIMANGASLAGHVTIGRGAIVSGLSGIHQFVRVGEFAFLGAMAGFNMDIPPYTIATGVRAKLFGLNLIGLRRNGFSKEAIAALKKAYAIIWRSDMNRDDALAVVEREMGSFPEVMKLTSFIRESQRGVAAHEEAPEDLAAQMA